MNVITSRGPRSHWMPRASNNHCIRAQVNGHWISAQIKWLRCVPRTCPNFGTTFLYGHCVVAQVNGRCAPVQVMLWVLHRRLQCTACSRHVTRNARRARREPGPWGTMRQLTLHNKSIRETQVRRVMGEDFLLSSIPRLLPPPLEKQ